MERILWVLLITTIIWALFMVIEASAFDKSRSSGLVGRFDSPIAMLELADSQERFAAVLDQGERETNVRVMRINTYMDFVFILLYCVTLILLVAACSSTSSLTAVVAVTVAATGILDCWEDFRLLGQFKIMKSGVAIGHTLPRPVSLAKWGLFALDLSLVGFALLQARSHRTGNSALIAMAIFVFVAAGFTAVGLFRNRFIGVAALSLLPALLIAGSLGPYSFFSCDA